MDVFSAIDSMEPKAGIRFNHRRAIKPVRSLHNPLKSTEKCSRATHVLSGRVSVPPPPPHLGLCHMEWKKAEFLADRVDVPNGQTRRGGGVSGSRNCGRT